MSNTLPKVMKEIFLKKSLSQNICVWDRLFRFL